MRDKDHFPTYRRTSGDSRREAFKMEYCEYIVNFGSNHQTLTSLISGRKGSEDGRLTIRLDRRG